jgi:diadenylate cyclase
MVELFKIGFISFTLLDLIDVLLMAYAIFLIYKFVKGTIAAQILAGLIFVLFLSFLAQAANMKALGWALKLISDFWVITFIVLFQPELRKALLMLGQNPFIRFFVEKSKSESNIEIIIDAAFEMSQLQHGALIVITRNTELRMIAETGIQLNARLSKELIKSIFYPRSPLHDGAVVVTNDVILAAKVALPLSQNSSYAGIPLGMRHRAGLGISEISDALCIIVSEETGSVSLTENGKLYRGLSKSLLKEQLNALILSDKEKKNWKNIFSFYLI